MPKAEEKIITHRVDITYNVDRLVDAMYCYRSRLFVLLTFWGIFFIAEGLLFAQKSLGNISDNGFWAYTFVLFGLMLVLKAAVMMLMRPWK